MRRRPKRERNLYSRSGVWHLRAIVNGVEVRESLHTRDAATARQHRNRRLEELNRAHHHGQHRITWHDACVAWAEHIAGQIASSTAKRYGVSLEQCDSVLGGYGVAAIDGAALNALISSRQKAGAKSATIRRDLTAISRVLEFAEAQDWREGNPTLSKRRLLKERRDPITLPDHADVEAMIAVCSSRFGALVRAAWLTGCRQDELVRLKWRAIKGRTAEIIGKGNKRRVIDLSDAALVHIGAQPRVIGRDLIFAKDDGSAFAQAASDFTHFRRLLPKDARRFRFHDLRHLFAVEALRDGMSLYDLAAHLGHTSVKTTESVYLAFLTPEQERAAKRGELTNGTKKAHGTAVQETYDDLLVNDISDLEGWPSGLRQRS
jgi:integrase/recombinase XerD